VAGGKDELMSFLRNLFGRRSRIAAKSEVALPADAESAFKAVFAELEQRSRSAFEAHKKLFDERLFEDFKVPSSPRPRNQTDEHKRGY